MALDIDLGVDLDIIDEAPPAAGDVTTDTTFLLHSVTQGGSPTTAQLVRSPAEGRTKYAGETALHAYIDAFFNVAGGGRLWIASLTTGVGANVTTDIAKFNAVSGPGQLVAPEVVAAADQAVLRDWAWNNNRIYVANLADAATEAALTTAATALIGPAGRNSELEADWLDIAGTGGGASRPVAASIVKAALMARNDRVTGNPNLAAAGNHTPGAGGVASPYVLGIRAERGLAEQQRLARAQVNTFRTVSGTVRAYGYWTLADLNTLPQWWDVGGSRTIMAIRAEEETVAEELMFGQVAADGAFLDRYKGALSGVLAKYQRIGAIYGNAESMGYRVDVSAAVNPLAEVAKGNITAQIVVKTSPFAAALQINLTRRAITQEVA